MRTTAIVLALCLTAATLPAAERPPIGSRVRALGPDGVEIKGTLTSYGASDLTITTGKGGRAVTIGFDRLERMRVPDGHDYLGGFALGTVGGVVLAFLAGLVGPSGGCSEGECILATIVYSLVTVPLGAIIGTAAAPQRWRDVPLPASTPTSSGLGFRIAPVQGGARFALSLGF
jgi:hypothetical protein